MIIIPITNIFNVYALSAIFAISVGSTWNKWIEFEYKIYRISDWNVTFILRNSAIYTYSVWKIVRVRQYSILYSILYNTPIQIENLVHLLRITETFEYRKTPLILARRKIKFYISLSSASPRKKIIALLKMFYIIYLIDFEKYVIVPHRVHGSMMKKSFRKNLRARMASIARGYIYVIGAITKQEKRRRHIPLQNHGVLRWDHYIRIIKTNLKNQIVFCGHIRRRIGINVMWMYYKCESLAFKLL